MAQIAFANGGRSLLIASGSQVHTLSLDDSLLPIARSVQTVAGSGETLRGLAVVAGGDGYVATSDTQAYWHGFGKNTALARRALPAGLRVQQAALAGKRLVLLAYSSVSQQFNLVRLPIDVAL